MKSLMQFTEKLSNAIEWICKVIAGLSVAIFVGIICMQVFGRNVLKIPMVWANDMSVLFFVWSCFFGSAVAVRYRSHYVLEFLPERFVKSNAFLDIIGDISGIIFFYILIRYGYTYTLMGLKRMSPSMNIPQAWCFACIPISGCFMMWYSLQQLVHNVKRFIELMQRKGDADHDK